MKISFKIMFDDEANMLSSSYVNPLHNMEVLN
jgi:hypothetical protein